MSPFEPSVAPTIGALGAHAGFGRDECDAIRRHAEREESRGDFVGAAETWQVAALLEPGELSSWLGLARCFRKLGDGNRAREAEQVAEAMRRVFR